mmetsp:Transcript_99340/g.289920  ORF Transcript_99340/g.289920 Transcript_99340/m.289920 type:complete len:303 (-) Transcript_99340:38-946(-)
MLNYLAMKNPHPRDGLLRFDKDAHVYTVDGEVYSSVTAFWPEFPVDLVAKRVIGSKRYGDSDYEYTGKSLEQIKAMWETWRDLGTEMHAAIELHLNRRQFFSDLACAHTELQQFNNAVCRNESELLNTRTAAEPPFPLQFLREQGAQLFPDFGLADAVAAPREGLPPSVAPEREYYLEWLPEFLALQACTLYRTEWRIFHEDVQVAGTVDLVCRLSEDDAGGRPQVILVDWKRSKNFKKEQYTQQLNAYRYILEKKYGMVVRACFVLRFHPQEPCCRQNDIELLSDAAIETIFRERGPRGGG